MLKFIFPSHATRAARRQLEEQREAVKGWTLFFGRDAAELWLQALSARDTARLSNA